jgi:hypothetical protein
MDEDDEEREKDDQKTDRQAPGDRMAVRKLALAAVIQGLAREALYILLRELWRSGPR